MSDTVQSPAMGKKRDGPVHSEETPFSGLVQKHTLHPAVLTALGPLRVVGGCSQTSFGSQYLSELMVCKSLDPAFLVLRIILKDKPPGLLRGCE